MLDPSYNPLIATKELIAVITARLSGYQAEEIILSREDALLALSLIECMKELLEREAGPSRSH